MVGFATLGVFGISELQKQDPRGVAILALLVSGLVLTLTHIWAHNRRVRKTQRFLVGRPFRAHTFHTSASEEYAYPPADVRDAIRGPR
ncbi:DUF3953 domain-containing protein [Pseudarthrobacter sp. CC4]|uniref:DUF3953 domain-containing protein n=1 Tax=Pseudarthrobacter sp. CC4 TaxID=3029190 RepID=UPI003B9FD644